MKLRYTLIQFFVLLLIIGAVVAATLYFTKRDTIYFALSIGALGSIIASIIYGIFSFILIREPSQERDKLKKLLVEFQERELKGVSHICHKFEQKPEYWNGLIAASTNKLDMLGHAFTTWTHQPHTDFFSKKIVKILKNGGIVRIVILSPDGENTSRLTKRVGKPYPERANETLQFIKTHILDKLSNSKKDNLFIKLERESEIPYMYINNGNKIVVSPYYSKVSDSKDNLVIEFDTKSKFGGSYSSDFDLVFKTAQEWKA